LSEFFGEYQSFKDHNVLLEKGTIAGKHLKDIWAEVADVF